MPDFLINSLAEACPSARNQFVKIALYFTPLRIFRRVFFFVFFFLFVFVLLLFCCFFLFFFFWGGGGGGEGGGGGGRCMQMHIDKI